jgi:hypothetical protein
MVDRSSAPASGLDAFRELERWLSGQAACSSGMSELERESERQGREILRLALQAHIDARGDGDVGAAIMVDGDPQPQRLTHKRLHTRPLVTLFGEVRVTRMGYGARGQDAIHPLDAELRLPGRLWSYECQRRLIRAVVCGPFDEAIALIAEMTGTTIPKRSAEQLVQDAAVDFHTFYAGRAAEQVAPADGEILVGAIDCKGIPMVKPAGAQKVVRRTKGEKANKKKMATVAAVHSQPPMIRTPSEVIDSLFCTGPTAERPKRPKPTRKRVWASLTAGKDAFISDVKAEMTRRDPDHQRTWVIVTDGERALQRRVITTFTDVTLVLDLLHVMDKLWKVAHVLHREGTPEAEQFVRHRTERILCGMVGQVVKGLRQTVTKRRLTGAKAKTTHSACDYLYANRDRMRYDEYLRNGWPIASGTVEGACKNLIRDRFERSGMRWTPQTAEALLKLRAAHLSGDLQDYWEHHVQADQQRLYHHATWRPAPVVLK